jgi:hypothetical protein
VSPIPFLARTGYLQTISACVAALVAVTLLVLTPGCGGGTTGTGSSGSTDFTGRVLDENGAPVPGAVVMVDANGATAATTTGADGTYSVTLAAALEPGEDVSYSVTTEDGTSSGSLTVSEAKASIEATLTVREAGELDIDETVAPTPTPDTRPTSTPRPDPTRTPSPTKKPDLVVRGNVRGSSRAVLIDAKVQVVGRAKTRTPLDESGNFALITDGARSEIGIRFDSQAGTGTATISGLPPNAARLRMRLRAAETDERRTVDLTVQGCVAVLPDGTEVQVIP